MKLRHLLYFTIFFSISGCGMLPPKPMPIDAKISFNNETHVVNKGMGYSGAGGSVHIGGENHFFLYKRKEAFKDEAYGAIIGIKCEERLKDIQVCLLFQKTSGTSMYTRKTDFNTDSEWELLPVCGLYVDGNAKTIPINNLNSYVEKELEIKHKREIDQMKSIQQQRELERKRYSDKVEKANLAWKSRMNYQIYVGDKVCTYGSNLFGFVESVSGDNIKFNIVGKSIGSSGNMFLNNDGDFIYDKLNQTTWVKRDELAKCGFQLKY